ncbi:hypothetical protein D8856_09730 [Streptococcus mitis]|uniref:Uncharacterized protein n=1 Tax=Streptococcus mitis TaxID=28037 RepID=A0A3R9J8T4_STRMT|nr:hypothetical protein D8856_09730 [Streptococcus mitis]
MPDSAVVDSATVSDEEAVDAATDVASDLTAEAADWLFATEASDTCEVASFKAASLFEATSGFKALSATWLDGVSELATVSAAEVASAADLEVSGPDFPSDSGTVSFFSVEVLGESVLASVLAATAFPPKNMKAATATEATPTLNLRTEYRSRFSALALYNLRRAFLSMNVSPCFKYSPTTYYAIF